MKEEDRSMGDENGAGAEMGKLAVKLNDAKSLGRVSSAGSGSSTSRSSLTSVRSLESLLTEDREFWSASLSFQKLNKEEAPRPPLLRSQSGGLISDIEMIKERFSRLLLGEDMSGSGRGVCTALAISNAITNLYASIFGQLWRLEPLPVEKKKIWGREMDILLAVTDHIVEMVPSYKIFPNGTKLEVMTTKQRSDLSVNLPALRKLDSMLLELLDGFSDTEFWYVDQGKADADTDSSELSEKAFERQKEKWWLPVPQIPEGGLSLDSKTQLERKRECATQILRASMLINTDTLSEMDVPDSYFETLPKTGKACLGDQFYKLIASDRFSVESVFDCLDLSADHIVLDLVNRLETAIYLRHTRTQSRLIPASSHSTIRSSAAEAERRELFSARAEDLLLTLKHQFPHLPHTTLEATKIQCNKDVGKSILESYSRVLETLAYNIVSRIDDVLFITSQPEFPLHSSTMTPSHHTVSDFHSRPLTRNPSRNSSATHSLPQTPLHNSSKPGMGPFLKKPTRHSCLTKRLLANYLCIDPHSKHRHRSNDESVLAVSNPITDTVLPPGHPPTGTHKRRNSYERKMPRC